jgi:DNA polymerase III epsilon subunit-like protein
LEKTIKKKLPLSYYYHLLHISYFYDLHPSPIMRQQTLFECTTLEEMHISFLPKDLVSSHLLKKAEVLVVGLDFETTGRSIYKDRVCQLGASIWDTQPLSGSDNTDTTSKTKKETENKTETETETETEKETENNAEPEPLPLDFCMYVDPQQPMSFGAYKIHHIEESSYRDAPTIAPTIRKWAEWIAAHCRQRNVTKVLLVAQNGHPFDFRLLAAEMLRTGMVGGATEEDTRDTSPITMYTGDSLLLFKKWYPEQSSHSLGTLHNSLLGKELDNAHDALVDVIAIKNLFDYSCEHLSTTMMCEDIMAGSKRFVNVVRDVDQRLPEKNADYTRLFEKSDCPITFCPTTNWR